ncbi:MAG: DUF4287 domain-containing protein, partial [Candidatus Nanopelagicales bacterium]
MATSPDRASHFPAIEKRYGKPMSYWFTQMKKVKGEKYADQMAFLQERHGFSRAHANALVLYLKGSTSSRRYDTFDDYLATLDEPKAKTIRAIFATLTAKFKKAEVVIAWNQPMLKQDGRYLFGASAQKAHILIAPFNADIIDELRPRLEGYEVNKKTVRVPVDWTVDKKLLTDMVSA